MELRVPLTKLEGLPKRQQSFQFLNNFGHIIQLQEPGAFLYSNSSGIVTPQTISASMLSRGMGTENMEP